MASIAACAVLCVAASALAQTHASDSPRPPSDWPSTGRDPGALRHSPLLDVDPGNVGDLEIAWTYRTGERVSRGDDEIRGGTAFEGTPILVDGSLFLCTPMNRVIALDPETGRESWRFDPEIDATLNYANQLVCRGLVTWLDSARPVGSQCRRRLFMGTNDARLIALDAATGRPCADFGTNGEVALQPAAGDIDWPGEYQVTSPPAVAQDIIVVGSAVADNERNDAPSGVVRGFDARSGALRWAWDLAPPGFVHTRENTSASGFALSTPNVWAPIAVDPDRDLVFVPTGNPSPDYARGIDSRLDHYGSSVVALRGSTGEVVWSFQTVHHDLWDFDLPAQPTLFPLRRGGTSIPALVQATKMGLLFVLDSVTGAPLFDVEERPVPRIEVRGERQSPSQPFPVKPPPLVPLGMTSEDAFGITPWDRGRCRALIAGLDNLGIYTPPTARGSLMFPGNAGGSNWGGVAVDPDRQLLVANTQSLAWSVALFPADEYAEQKRAHPGVEVAPQRGERYGMRREILLSPLGLPCNPPPWGTLAAVDLANGSIRWQVPLGTIRDVAPIPLPIKLGVPNLGGPLVTASGLVFIGAALDDYLRAFDIETGEELWAGRLPAGGQATPMTYRATPLGVGIARPLSSPMVAG